MENKQSSWFDSGAVAWALNVGGAAYLDIDGVRYDADHQAGDAERGAIDNVLGAQDATVYQTYRTGELLYRQSLPNGRYDLTLQFAEPGDAAAGERLFEVLAQGEVAVESLDVRSARDGNAGFALERTVTGVEVGDGILEIRLRAISGEPLLNGLVVRRQQPDTRDWELIWSDEFDYEGAPDPANWNIELWPAGKVNQEAQAYTDRDKNLRVTDGMLVIEAHREDYGNARYTSGRVQSQGKFDFLYGRVDIRARLPAGRGIWAALWMLPSDPFRYATTCSADGDWHGNDACDAWPNSGEIDIMEHVGWDPHRVHGTVHNRAYFPGNGQQRKGSVEVRDVSDTFHIYSLQWDEDFLRIYIDGTPYFTYRKTNAGWEAWPYDHPFHLIFNLALGGTWGSVGGPIDDGIFPASMEVDYVRVFKPAR